VVSCRWRQVLLDISFVRLYPEKESKEDDAGGYDSRIDNDNYNNNTEPKTMRTDSEGLIECEGTATMIVSHFFLVESRHR